MKTIGAYFCAGLLLICSSCLTTSQELSDTDTPPGYIQYALDFEHGIPADCELGEGWDVEEYDGSLCLVGRRHSFAFLPQAEDMDVTLSFRLKLDTEARIHINIRQGRGNVPRYFVGFDQHESSLSRQNGQQDFQDCVRGGPGLGTGWHQVTVSAVGDTVTVLVDGNQTIRYTDRNPARAYGLSFECLSENPVYIDDVELRLHREPEKLTWVRTGGPLGGMGYDIRMDPGNPDILYVTDAESGVFKSTDGGRNWRAINQGIVTRTGATGDLIPIFCLSLDPNDSNVLWAGTQGQSGLYRSTDAGENWEIRNNGISERDLTFRGVAVHPENPKIVFAAAEVPSREWAGEPVPGREFDQVKGVVYKTIDGGRNWRRVWFGDNLARYILIDPRNPDIIYVSTGIFDREAANADYTIPEPGGVGILKSTDGGETWSTVNRGLESLYVGSLVMHPDNPDILMAGVGVITYWEGSGVYITTDGGRRWTKTLDHFSEAVEFAPSNPDIAYTGDTDAFYRSEDGGWTWERSVPDLPAWWGDDGIPVGHPIDIVVDPRNPYRLFVNAYGGGTFVSSDGGITWNDASKGYTGAQVRDIDVFPGSDSRVIVAARSGVFASENSGEDWTGWATGKYRFLDWHTVSVNPEDPDIVLSELTCERMAVRSTDGGRTWTEVERLPKKMGWGAIEWAPSDPNVVYAGSTGYNSCGGFDLTYPAGGVLKSTDGGKTWQDANADGTETLSVVHLAVHPQDAGDVLFGSGGEGLWHTSNGGADWENIGGSVFRDRRVTCVARHPAAPETIFAGTERGGLKVSRDGGRRWETAGYGVNPEATVVDMAFDPRDPDLIYLADITGGVYRSTDGGSEWRPINTGLSIRAVNALALTDNGRHLYAATEGGGVYRLDLE